VNHCKLKKNSHVENNFFSSIPNEVLKWVKISGIYHLILIMWVAQFETLKKGKKLLPVFNEN
jgi:hypothetical protein